MDEALNQTELAMQFGESCIIEGAFHFDGIVIRVDILREFGPDTCELIEVKSSLAPKEVHIQDLALQKYVLEQNGIIVEKVTVMCLKKAYEYGDHYDNLFTPFDVTDRVNSEILPVPTNVAQFREILSQEEEPQIPIGSHCEKPYPCPFKHHCMQDMPTQSIFTIPRISGAKKDHLIQDGVFSIYDLPDDFPLTEKQGSYVNSIQEGQPQINIPGIQAEMQHLSYPLYFLDFETLSSPLPRFPGLHPFSRLPFQFSLHVDDGSGNLSHVEYLHTRRTDPRPNLVEALLKEIGEVGSIVVYNKTFEQSIIEALADAVPQYRDRLLGLISRLWDQLAIFRRHYQHPGFLGSSSLKAVLPVIAPELSYQDLTLQNGNDAAAIWNTIIGLPYCQERERRIEALRAYCHMDTLAMVKIHHHLLGIINSGSLHG